MRKFTLAAGVAVLAMSAAPVAAQSPQRSEAEVTATMRYLLPHIVSGIATRCSTELSPDGYLEQNSERLIAKFQDGVDENWAVAKPVLIDMAMRNSSKSKGANLYSVLPDETLKSVVDTMVPATLAEKVKPKDCGMAERILENLDPLPADNLAALFGIIIGDRMLSRSRTTADIDADQ